MRLRCFFRRAPMQQPAANNESSFQWTPEQRQPQEQQQEQQCEEEGKREEKTFLLEEGQQLGDGKHYFSKTSEQAEAIFPSVLGLHRSNLPSVSSLPPALSSSSSSLAGVSVFPVAVGDASPCGCPPFRHACTSLQQLQQKRKDRVSCCCVAAADVAQEGVFRGRNLLLLTATAWSAFASLNTLQRALRTVVARELGDEVEVRLLRALFAALDRSQKGVLTAKDLEWGLLVARDLCTAEFYCSMKKKSIGVEAAGIGSGAARGPLLSSLPTPVGAAASAAAGSTDGAAAGAPTMSVASSVGASAATVEVVGSSRATEFLSSGSACMRDGGDSGVSFPYHVTQRCMHAYPAAAAGAQQEQQHDSRQENKSCLGLHHRPDAAALTVTPSTRLQLLLSETLKPGLRSLHKMAVLHATGAYAAPEQLLPYILNLHMLLGIPVPQFLLPFTRSILMRGNATNTHAEKASPIRYAISTLHNNANSSSLNSSSSSSGASSNKVNSIGDERMRCNCRVSGVDESSTRRGSGSHGGASNSSISACYSGGLAHNLLREDGVSAGLLGAAALERREDEITQQEAAAALANQNAVWLAATTASAAGRGEGDRTVAEEDKDETAMWSIARGGGRGVVQEETSSKTYQGDFKPAVKAQKSELEEKSHAAQQALATGEESKQPAAQERRETSTAAAQGEAAAATAGEGAASEEAATGGAATGEAAGGRVTSGGLASSAVAGRGCVTEGGDATAGRGDAAGKGGTATVVGERWIEGGEARNRSQKTVLQLAAEEHQTSSWLEEVIAGMDTDGSGTIEFVEFLAASLDKWDLLGREEICRAAFRYFDRDFEGHASYKALLTTLCLSPAPAAVAASSSAAAAAASRCATAGDGAAGAASQQQLQREASSLFFCEKKEDNLFRARPKRGSLVEKRENADEDCSPDRSATVAAETGVGIPAAVSNGEQAEKELLQEDESSAAAPVDLLYKEDDDFLLDLEVVTPETLPLYRSVLAELKAVDADKDGFITFEEFLRLLC